MLIGIVEIIIAIAAWILAVHKQAARRGAVIMSLGSLLVLVSRGQEWGRYPMAIGFTLNLVAGLLVLLVFLPIGMAADKVMERSPHARGRIMGMYIFVLASFSAIMAVMFTDIYLFPMVMNILFMLIVFLWLTAALPGVSKNLSAWNGRLVVLGIALVSSYAYVHLPYPRQVQLARMLQQVGGTEAVEIKPRLDDIRNGTFSFYSELKSNTPIYRYRQDEDGTVHLYRDGGGNNIDPLTGDKMPLVSQKIIRLYTQQQTRREAKEKQAAEAALKAQQDAAATEQKRQQEAARVEQQEKEALLAMERNIEQKQEEEFREARRVALSQSNEITLHLTTDMRVSTERARIKDFVIATLVEPIRYNRLDFRAGESRVFFQVDAFAEGTDQHQPFIRLGLVAIGSTQNGRIGFGLPYHSVTLSPGSTENSTLLVRKGKHLEVPANFPITLTVKVAPQ